MNAVLFIGPTLPADEARATFGRDHHLHLLPPATQGDVLACLALEPRVIGLVDGRFDGLPSVLHKEILHALAAGVTVLGAASMGALRAAELHAFGMLGIGAVFEDFRDGRLQADDEVALVHAGADHAFAPLSEALVDIRATLEAAVREHVIEHDTATGLIRRACALHYPERQWSTLLAGLDGGIAARLRAWLPGGRVHRKRDDALRLVALMREHLGTSGETGEPAWRLQRSHFWEDFRARHAPVTGHDGAVLDELRLQPRRWRELARTALLRLLARREAAREDLTAAPALVTRALAEFRARHALATRTDLEHWLAETGIGAAVVEAALQDEARLTELAAAFGPGMDAALLVEAALAGELPALRRRADRKRRLLDEQGLAASPLPADAALLAWYFRECLHTEPPADVAAHAADLGLADRDHLLHLLAREYLYRRSTEADPDTPSALHPDLPRHE